MISRFYTFIIHHRGQINNNTFPHKHTRSANIYINHHVAITIMLITNGKLQLETLTEEEVGGLPIANRWITYKLAEGTRESSTNGVFLFHTEQPARAFPGQHYYYSFKTIHTL